MRDTPDTMRLNSDFVKDGFAGPVVSDIKKTRIRSLAIAVISRSGARKKTGILKEPVLLEGKNKA
jgi:hypothetical protein